MKESLRHVSQCPKLLELLLRRFKMISDILMRAEHRWKLGANEYLLTRAFRFPFFAVRFVDEKAGLISKLSPLQLDCESKKSNVLMSNTFFDIFFCQLLLIH